MCRHAGRELRALAQDAVADFGSVAVQRRNLVSSRTSGVLVRTSVRGQLQREEPPEDRVEGIAAGFRHVEDYEKGWRQPS